MKDYKGYSEKQRKHVQYLLNKAIRNGEMKNPCLLPCEICGQKKGIREWHSKDYAEDTWKDNLQCLCWRCHRMLHVFEQGPISKRYESARIYFQSVKNGMIFDPVYTTYYTEEMEREIGELYGDEN